MIVYGNALGALLSGEIDVFIVECNTEANWSGYNRENLDRHVSGLQMMDVRTRPRKLGEFSYISKQVNGKSVLFILAYWNYIKTEFDRRTNIPNEIELFSAEATMKFFSFFKDNIENIIPKDIESPKLAILTNGDDSPEKILYIDEMIKDNNLDIYLYAPKK